MVGCVECRPADKPWDVCGVCDTPELWCGAAGLCARVRACAGAAESYIYTLHTYYFVIYILYIYLSIYIYIYNIYDIYMYFLQLYYLAAWPS